MTTKTPNFRPRRTKPCPDLPKGTRCPLCGSEYVCTQSWRKLPAAPEAGKGKESSNG